MDEKIKYTSVNELSSNIESISILLSNLLSTIKEVNSAIGNDSTWSGDAASNYKSSFDESSSQFDSINSEMVKMSKYILEALNKYKQVDYVVTTEGGS